MIEGGVDEWYGMVCLGRSLGVLEKGRCLGMYRQRGLIAWSSCMGPYRIVKVIDGTVLPRGAQPANQSVNQSIGSRRISSTTHFIHRRIDRKRRARPISKRKTDGKSPSPFLKRLDVEARSKFRDKVPIPRRPTSQKPWLLHPRQGLTELWGLMIGCGNAE